MFETVISAVIVCHVQLILDKYFLYHFGIKKYQTALRCMLQPLLCRELLFQHAADSESGEIAKCFRALLSTVLLLVTMTNPTTHFLGFQNLRKLSLQVN